MLDDRRCIGYRHKIVNIFRRGNVGGLRSAYFICNEFHLAMVLVRYIVCVRNESDRIGAALKISSS